LSKTREFVARRRTYCGNIKAWIFRSQYPKHPTKKLAAARLRNCVIHGPVSVGCRRSHLCPWPKAQYRHLLASFYDFQLEVPGPAVMLRATSYGRFPLGGRTLAKVRIPHDCCDRGNRCKSSRVEAWRGGVRLSMSVSAPFVWRCLSGSTMAPFPRPAHRTGRADFPHPALGQELTRSFACDAIGRF
jgi:hypothetical protein